MSYIIATFDSINGGFVPVVDGNSNLVAYASIALATAAGFSLDNGVNKSFAIYDQTPLAYETPDVISGGVYVS